MSKKVMKLIDPSSGLMECRICGSTHYAMVQSGCERADGVTRYYRGQLAVFSRSMSGQDYHGRGSIRQWKQAADAKYRYVLQTVNVQTLGVLVTVRARLTGDFPGSPVEVDHIFRLSSDKIASLEIRS